MNTSTPQPVPMTARLAPVFVALSLGLYLVIDLAVLPIITVQRALYPAMLVAFTSIVLVSLKDIRTTSRTTYFVSAWVVACAFFALPAVTQATFYTQYFFADSASLIFPLVLFVVGLRYPELYSYRLGLPLIVILASIGVIAAPIVGEEMGRYEAPISPLFAIGWALVIFAKRPSARFGSFIYLLALVVFAFYSGERTSVVLWLSAMLLCAFVIARLTWAWILAGLATLMVAGVFGGQILSVVVQDYLETSRFRAVAQGETDESILARLDEGRDVLIMLEDASVTKHIAGHGHGATYRPYYSLMEPNLTDEGLVHNIHIGPLLIYFRYGVLGSVIFALLIISVTRSVFRLRGQYRRGELTAERFTFVVSVSLYLADWLVRNVLVDPIWAYVLAGYLLTHRNWLRAPQSA